MAIAVVSGMLMSSVRVILRSLLMSILLTAAAVGRAQPGVRSDVRAPGVCRDIFAPTKGSSADVIETAIDRLQQPEAEEDEIDAARMMRYKSVVAMSDEEFAALATAQAQREARDETVEMLVSSGMTLADAVKSKMGLYDEAWEHRVVEFDERGRLKKELLPRVSLSLENGRQKLDFARIHFTKRDPRLAELVLRDYLMLAEKHRSLKFLIVTNRDDLDEKLKLVSADVRKRIRVERTESDLWIWAQDGSKPIDLPKSTAEFGQARYIEATNQLSDRRVIDARTVRVRGWDHGFFQGGNIIVGDRHAFVGKAEIYQVRLAYRESETGALRILSEIFQKPTVPAYVRTNAYGADEWSFHIDLDMVIAVNRKTNVEVALVRSAEELMNRLSGEKLPTDFNNADVESLRRKIVERYAKGDFGKPLAKGSREFLKRFSSTPIFELKKMIYEGRIFSRLIASYGYEVRALPGFGDAQALGQSMFFGTNAVLTEGLAIIPGNEMPELDGPLKVEYEELGYQVVPMRSSSETICQQGGLRCVTETYRKPYLTSRP